MVPDRAWITVNAVLLEDTPWAPKGHVVGATQFEINLDLGGETGKSGRTRGMSVGAGNPDSQLSCVQDADAVTVTIDGTAAAAVDAKTGNLQSLSTPSGKSLLASPLSLNFTRAATDNDQGGIQMLVDCGGAPAWAVKALGMVMGTKMFSHKYKWGLVGLAQSSPPTQVCGSVTTKDASKDASKTSGEKTSNFTEVTCDAVTTSSEGGKAILNTRTVYGVYRNGDVRVRCKVQPANDTVFGGDLPSLARVGVTLALDSSLFNITYLGKGVGQQAGENYPDRDTAADLGITSTTPAEMHVPYIFPSENGARGGCSWAAFADEDGEGVLVRADGDGEGGTFSFSASLHSAGDLDAAKHTHDLEDRKQGAKGSNVHVTLSHKIMGVGGDLSWLPCVYAPYLVDPKETYEFGFWLCPLARGQSPVKQAKRRVGGQ